MVHPLVSGLASVGAIAVLVSTYFAVQFISIHYLLPAKPLKAYKRVDAEAYAVITDCSDEIGLGIAQELVRQGFSIVFLGRNQEEVAASAKELGKVNPNAQVTTLVLDPSTASVEDIEQAISSIAKLEVSILVNNVGSNPVKEPRIREFNTYSCDDVDTVIDTNARFMARFTTLMMPILSSRDRRAPEERSLILNISSVGMHGVPWLVMYSATKAFNWSFSIGLARELELHPETNHIDCLAVVPGDVLMQHKSKGLVAVDPRSGEFGRNTVLKVDGALQWGLRSIQPNWRHDLALKAIFAAPEWALTERIKELLEQKQVVWKEWSARKS